ncbi:phosphotransferase [Kaarinaea lacus]
MKKPKYTYSQLSSESVEHLANRNYDLPGFQSCKYYVLGLHDNYLLQTEDTQYILRIYRNNWRSRDEIFFELELLDFLGFRNAPVAAPIATSTGELCFFVDSPEGKRAAALFPYALGIAPGNEITEEESTLLGETVARIHDIAQGFETSYIRPRLDIPYLLDESILAIEPFIETDARNYLRTLQKDIKDTLPIISQTEPCFGICVGDVNASNFHIDADKRITLFDFDQCGYGYRAFEIGKYVASLKADSAKKYIADAFVNGYQRKRQLTEEELGSIPIYEKLANIWVMAIHVYNADRIGYKWLENPFWERWLAKLQALDT